MTAHTTYLSYFIPDPNWQKLTLAVVLGGSLVLLGKKLCARVKTASGLESAIIPEEKTSVFGFFDFLIESFTNFYDSILGKEHREHLPFVATAFFFILFANLLGLIPGMPAITTTVWVNVAMAVVVFSYFNWQGVKANGFWGYLKHFCGPVWWLAWFILPIEIFSTVLRILTLNLRLYWNITGDHILLNVFVDLLSGGVFTFLSIIFYFLGTFVSFMQAFVFTVLTMIYILLATQHEEDH